MKPFVYKYFNDFNFLYQKIKSILITLIIYFFSLKITAQKANLWINPKNLFTIYL
jgi:putative effector of murein hydrolase